MTTPKQPVGIQSVEIGVGVLQAMAAIGAPATLGVIARRSQMPPNKTHRYLVSFVRTGLVSQRRDSGEYELGPALRALGLTALRLMDPYARLFEYLRALREELKMTTFVAVWTDAGATIICWENGVHYTTITFRLGSTLPLTRSATGRVFLAYLPATITKAALRREAALDGRSRGAGPEPAAELELIRERGYSHSSDEILPGVDALSAPVFDETNSLFAVLSVIGPSSYLQGRIAEEARTNLLRTAAAASAELGSRR